MPTLTRINKIEELKPYELKLPLTPLILKGEDGYFTSNKWFVNHLGELIFDIKNNVYVIPYYYDNGASVIEDIYVIND